MDNEYSSAHNSTTSELTSPPVHLVKLADGFSIQTKTASKFWIVLAIISTLVVIPSPNGTVIKIPFEMGEVQLSDFYPFAALLISVLIIGFSSAHVQSIRSRRLIQRVIDSAMPNPYLPGKIHLRDFVDSIVSPSMHRTAPLAQYLRGKHQFFPESGHSSILKNIISTVVYILLKITSIFVIYLFPAFALFKSSSLGNLYSLLELTWNIPNIIFLFIVLVAAFILLELLISELNYAITSIRYITARNIDRKS